MEYLIGIGIAVALVILFFIAGYVKAPPDTAYIISGFRKPRILIGKAGIRIPFLERMDKLSLKMFSVDVKTTDYVPNAEYINVKVDATVKEHTLCPSLKEFLLDTKFPYDDELESIREVHNNRLPF